MNSIISLEPDSPSTLNNFLTKPFIASTFTANSLKSFLVKFNECIADFDGKPTKQEEDYFINVYNELLASSINELMKEDSCLNLLACCCIVDITRILTIQHSQIIKNLIPCVYLIINALNECENLKDEKYIAQYYYIFDILEKANFHMLFSNNLGQKANLNTENLYKLNDLLNFIHALINVSELARFEPGLTHKIRKILMNILSIANNNNDKECEECLLALLSYLTPNTKKNYTQKFDLLVSIFKEMPWSIKHTFSELISSIMRKKRKLKEEDMKEDQICYIITQIFKIDHEVLLPILSYFETEIKDSKNKDTRKRYIMTICKLCTSKSSRIGMVNQRFFNEVFINALTSKKDVKIRIDIVKYAIKYLQKFSYSRNVSSFEMSTSSINYDKIKQNINKIEGKLEDILRENDAEIKNLICEQFNNLLKEHPRTISRNLLETLVTANNNKFDYKGKLQSYELLANLYNYHCVNLYHQEIYDFDDISTNYKFVNGLITTDLLKKKEIGKEYLWIAEFLLAQILMLDKNEYILLIQAFNRMIGIITNQPDTSSESTNNPVNSNMEIYNSTTMSSIPSQNALKLRLKALIGLYYNLFKKNPRDIIDVNTLKYDDFITKILKFAWNEVYDDKLKQKQYLINMHSFKKILSISLKLNFDLTKNLNPNSRINNDNSIKKINDYCSSIFKDIKDMFTTLDQNKDSLKLQELLITLIDNSNDIPIKEKINSLNELNKHINNTDMLKLLNIFIIESFNKDHFQFINSVFIPLLKKKEIPLLLKESLFDLLNILNEFDSSQTLKTNTSSIELFIFENLETFINIINSNKMDSMNKTDYFINQNILMLMLKYLSIFNYQEHVIENIDFEDVKNQIYQVLIKMKFNHKQAKYAIRLIKKLDVITSEKVIDKLKDLFIQLLNEKSQNLLYILKVIHEILREDYSAYLDYLNITSELLFNLIKIPVSIPKSNIISENSLCKKIILKLHFENISKNKDNLIVNNKFVNFCSEYRDLLLSMLLYYNTLCSNHLKYDKDYLRIYAIKYLFDILSHDKNDDIDPEIYSKLSLLCFDDNSDLRKCFYHYLFINLSKIKYNLKIDYVVVLIFSCLDTDSNIKFIAERILLTYFNAIFRRQKNLSGMLQKFSSSSSKKNNNDDNIIQSGIDENTNDNGNKYHIIPEIFIIYIVYMMLNNPLLLLNINSINKNVFKCIEFFWSTLAKSDFKKDIKSDYVLYLLQILRDHYEPVIFQENMKTDLNFITTVKSKTVVKIGKKSNDSGKKSSNENEINQAYMSYQQIMDSLISNFQKYTQSSYIDIHDDKYIFLRKMIPQNIFKSKLGSNMGLDLLSVQTPKKNIDMSFMKINRDSIVYSKDKNPELNYQKEAILSINQNKSAEEYLEEVDGNVKEKSYDERTSHNIEITNIGQENNILNYGKSEIDASKHEKSNNVDTSKPDNNNIKSEDINQSQNKEDQLIKDTKNQPKEEKKDYIEEEKKNPPEEEKKHKPEEHSQLKKEDTSKKRNRSSRTQQKSSQDNINKDNIEENKPKVPNRKEKTIKSNKKQVTIDQRNEEDTRRITRASSNIKAKESKNTSSTNNKTMNKSQEKIQSQNLKPPLKISNPPIKRKVESENKRNVKKAKTNQS